jgi:microcystin-dependent protein
MGQPYVGEIRMFGGSFAPAGWMFCSGQTLPISEFDVLFNLIGTTYGGDGQETFQLPDLQGRFPMQQGNGFVIGEKGGTETVTLTVSQIPAHAHTPNSSNAGGSDSPNGNVWANSSTGKPYVNVAGGVPAALNPTTVQSSGGNQPHDNMQPFLCITYIISLFGVYPTQN